MQHARQADIVCELALAGQQPGVLLAGHPFADIARRPGALQLDIILLMSPPALSPAGWPASWPASWRMARRMPW